MPNNILLTGAGFTHNFGAPLSAEISDSIFNNNNIQNNNILRSLLEKDFDYENVYQLVMQTDQYKENEKTILIKAINEAYKSLDDHVINAKPLTQTCSDLFNQLIFRFAKRMGGSGFIFTLNQDLFIERKFNHYPNTIVSSLELPIMGSSVFGSTNTLTQNNKRILPEGNDYNDAKKTYENKYNKNQIQLSYIKLHGSQEWFKNNNHHMMVIGHAKDKNIKEEPLLNWYFELFNNQLTTEHTQILIIGYNFNDEHINRVLHNRNKNIKIYIIDPKPRKQFMQDLLNKPFGDTLTKLIYKYYPRTLLELFPNDVTSNHHPDWNNLKSDFFLDK